MILTLSSILLVGLAASYATALAWLWTGFRRACRASSQKLDRKRPLPSVSVIVPARNEAANIVDCLSSIFSNDYPNFEVVVVDDESEDNTAQLARRFATENELVGHLTVVDARAKMEPASTGHKKRALALGIGRSQGDIIVTTDADSLVQSGWISSLVSHFESGVELVSAPVAYRENGSPLGRALALEMLGLVAVGAGGISNGQPNMCNGANLAYRRRAFERVGGFSTIDHLASGDDALLMLKMSSSNPSAVRFCPDPSALVLTQPADDLRSLFQQRKRWASKGMHYRYAGVTALAVLVYAFHLALLAALVTGIFVPQLWPAIGVSLGLKLISEGLILQSACTQFERRHLMRQFIPAQLLHIPYVVVIGFLGVFGSGFTWKGRALAR